MGRLWNLPLTPDTHISIFYSIYIVDQTQVSCTNAFCHFAVAVSCPVFSKKKKKKSKPVRYLHSFMLPLSFPFLLMPPFHHIAVVSVFVSPLNSGKLLRDGLEGKAAMVQLYCVPLQRQRDSGLISQVSWVFLFSMLEWTMPHASIWGIKHVPPA